MSVIALPDFEQNVRAALSRVLRGESLVLVDGGQLIANITPTTQDEVTTQSTSLVDFFLQSPLRDCGMEIGREPGDERRTIEF